MNHNAALVLNELERQAEQRHDLDLAWKATVGAIEILFWKDEFSRAAQLSERVVVDLGEQGTDLNYQTLPFTVAFLAAEAFAGEPAEARLHRLAGCVPRNSELGKRLSRSADRASTTPASEVLALHRPWAKRQRTPKGKDWETLQQDRCHLAPMQHRAVWGAAERANDPALARELVSEIGYPCWWPSTLWLGQWLVHEGNIAQATEALRAGRKGYLPHAPWSLLPNNPPVDPDLRPALTDEVREEFLAAVTMPDLHHA